MIFKIAVDFFMKPRVSPLTADFDNFADLNKFN